MNDDEIDEFTAAALVQMSPALLRSFASRAPKKGESRKLHSNKTGTHCTYSRKELLSFDAYLRKPWPAKEGERPHIPAPIQKEIKAESALQCAICHSNRDTCEIAHIEPVASSKCNHPHNLILLCANHHTKFDKRGVWGPSEEARKFVTSYKETLLYVTRVKWGSHASSIAECFSIAQLCRHLKKEIEARDSKSTAEQLDYYEQLADEAVASLKKSAVKAKRESRMQQGAATPNELWAKLESSVRKPTPSARLASAAELTLDDEFRAAAGFVDCPLCGGSGIHSGSVCPVCGGERQVDYDLARNIDLDLYKLIKCPLCRGKGRHDREDCPICQGDRMIERRFANQVDLVDFDEVDCPLCEGDGRWDGEDCPECSANRKMPRHAAERVDVQAYNIVDCPVCEGDGRNENGDPCRACGENGKMTRRQRDNTDLNEYKSITCRLCEGSGQFDDRGCPPCGGEGTMSRWDDNRTDWRQYDLVKCPRCRGSRAHYDHDCPKCAGEGQLFRRDAESD